MTKKQFIAAAFKLGFEAKYNGKNKTMYLYPQEKHTDDEKEIADLFTAKPPLISCLLTYNTRSPLNGRLPCLDGKTLLNERLWIPHKY